MSVIMQFNCLTHNETARKAMESYTGILQKAFEHYQNLWEDYIKLQEKCRQCNIHSSSQMKVTPCTKTKDKAMSQHVNNADVQENTSVPLLELDTISINQYNPINFNSDKGTNLSDTSESSDKNIDENNPPKSPIFSKTFLKTSNNSGKKFLRSPKIVYTNSTPDVETHRNIEKVSSKCNRKLEISTTHHVETTFLPNGKRLKQSRLAVYPVKNNEKTVFSSSIDKYKAANILHNIDQNFIEDVSVTNTTTDTSIIKNDTTTNTSETCEDVIEVSPTQRNVTSKVKRCLQLKRKIPVKHVKKSPDKNKCSSVVSEIIGDVDHELCPLPKRTSVKRVEDDKSLMTTAVNTLKDEDTLTGETFYLPAEQAAYRCNMDNFNLDDLENKPPKKKIVSKSKIDLSEQLNMRCKVDRAKLNGWDCWECREYYKNLSLSKEELQKRKNHCSRHRYKYERPSTPEGFWNPEFPETVSCTYRWNKS